jgi:hypothetical protein
MGQEQKRNSRSFGARICSPLTGVSARQQPAQAKELAPAVPVKEMGSIEPILTGTNDGKVITFPAPKSAPIFAPKSGLNGLHYDR